MMASALHLDLVFHLSSVYILFSWAVRSIYGRTLLDARLLNATIMACMTLVWADICTCPTHSFISRRFLAPSLTFPHIFQPSPRRLFPSIGVANAKVANNAAIIILLVIVIIVIIIIIIIIIIVVVFHVFFIGPDTLFPLSIVSIRNTSLTSCRFEEFAGVRMLLAENYKIPSSFGLFIRGRCPRCIPLRGRPFRCRCS